MVCRGLMMEVQASSGATSRATCCNSIYLRRAPAASFANGWQSRQRLSVKSSCAGPNKTPSNSAGSGEPCSEGYSSAGGWEAKPQPRASSNSSSSPTPSHSRTTSSSTSWDFSPEPFVPSPSNLPTNEEDPHSGSLLFPPHNLRPLRKDFWTLTDQPGIDLLVAGTKAWGGMHRIYVVLFGVGQRETEGIYSLRAYGSDGSPHETIIAFECEEEAQRYAGLLEASMEHTPHVCAIAPRELLSFCLDHSYACRLEPAGSLLIPPDSNVSLTDWERSLRLRDGKFAVLEAEPELRTAAAGGAATVTAPAPPAALPPVPEPPLRGGPASGLARYSGLSDAELAEVRARLEGLLPRE